MDIACSLYASRHAVMGIHEMVVTMTIDDFVSLFVIGVTAGFGFNALLSFIGYAVKACLSIFAGKEG